MESGEQSPLIFMTPEEIKICDEVVNVLQKCSINVPIPAMTAHVKVLQNFVTMINKAKEPSPNHGKPIIKGKK